MTKDEKLRKAFLICLSIYECNEGYEDGWELLDMHVKDIKKLFDEKTIVEKD